MSDAEHQQPWPRSRLDRDIYDEVVWRMDLLNADPPIDPDTGNFAVHSAPIVDVPDEDDE